MWENNMMPFLGIIIKVLLFIFVCVCQLSSNDLEQHMYPRSMKKLFYSGMLIQGGRTEKSSKDVLKEGNMVWDDSSKCPFYHKLYSGKNIYKSSKLSHEVQPHQRMSTCYPVSRILDALDGLQENVAALQRRVQEAREEIARARSFIHRELHFRSPGDIQNDQQSNSTNQTDHPEILPFDDDRLNETTNSFASNVIDGAERQGEQTDVASPVIERDTPPSILNAVTSVSPIQHQNPLNETTNSFASNVIDGAERQGEQTDVASPVIERDTPPSILNTVTSVSPIQRQNPDHTNNNHHTRNINAREDCVYPEFYRQSSRMSTFGNWRSSGQTREEMVRAGFYYVGNGDCVRCFSCGKGLRCWEETDDPWIEHARWSPNCRHVLNKKGQAFIDMVQMFARLPNYLQEETPVRQGQREPLVIIDQARRRQGQMMTRNPLLHPAAQGAIAKGFTPRMVKEAIDTLVQNYGWQCMCTGLLLTILFHRRGSNVQQRNQKDEPWNDREISDLQEENRRLVEQRLCKICLEKDVEILFLPCQHLCCCPQCAPAFVTCPICRRHIEGTVRVQF